MSQSFDITSVKFADIIVGSAYALLCVTMAKVPKITTVLADNVSEASKYDSVPVLGG